MGQYVAKAPRVFRGPFPAPSALDDAPLPLRRKEHLYAFNPLIRTYAKAVSI